MNNFNANHIERVAEALWQFDSEHAFGQIKPWDDVPVYCKNMYRGMANSAVAAFLKPDEPAHSAPVSLEKTSQTEIQSGVTL